MAVKNRLHLPSPSCLAKRVLKHRHYPLGLPKNSTTTRPCARPQPHRSVFGDPLFVAKVVANLVCGTMALAPHRVLRHPTEEENSQEQTARRSFLDLPHQNQAPMGCSSRFNKMTRTVHGRGNTMRCLFFHRHPPLTRGHADLIEL